MNSSKINKYNLINIHEYRHELAQHDIVHTLEVLKCIHKNDIDKPMKKMTI